MEKALFRCCSEKPAFLVTYMVAGSKKQYLVCSNCIKLECFSKHIISKVILENKIKNFQNEQSEISDETDKVSELNDEQNDQNEQETVVQ